MPLVASDDPRRFQAFDLGERGLESGHQAIALALLRPGGA
jgi:hypothetical protein